MFFAGVQNTLVDKFSPGSVEKHNISSSLLTEFKRAEKGRELDDGQRSENMRLFQIPVVGHFAMRYFPARHFTANPNAYIFPPYSYF